MSRTSWGVLLAATVVACGGATTGTGGSGGEDGGGEGAASSGAGGSSGSSGGSGSGGSGASSSSGSGSGASSGSSSGSASGGSSGASSGSSGAPGDGARGGSCSTDAQCGGGMICGFRTADACTAVGSCFPAPGAVCAAYSPGCACDGSEVNVICNGLPTGYAPRPLAHTGACTGLDAGSACTSDTQCAPGLKCCYPCGVQGCNNQCITPQANGTCPLYP